MACNGLREEGKFKQPVIVHEARDIMNKWNKPYDPLDGEETTKALIKDHQKYGELMKKLGLGIYKK